MPLVTSLTNLGNTLTTLKQRINGDRPTDLTYQDSLGLPLSDIFGHKRWTVVGTGLRKWEKKPEDLRQRIQELICENEGEIYKGQSIRATATTYHCWMMGHNAGSARPTVVISHSARFILKRTMKVILRNGVLKVHGFELKGCPSCDLRLLNNLPIAQLTHFTLPQRFPISLSGAQLSIGNLTRKATIGGVLILDGTYHGVTVAHAFTEDSRPTEQNSFNNNRVLYDSDWAEDSSEDEDGGMELGLDNATEASAAASTLERDGDNQNPTPVVDSSIVLTPSSIETFRVTSISSRYPLHDVEGSPFDGVDWAIFKISNSQYHGMNGVLLNGLENSWLYFEDVSKFSPHGSLIIATKSGAVNAIGTGSTSSIKLFGSSRFCNVWSIHPAKILEPGDSGSWVVDAVSGNIYGTLVASSAILQEGYVLPAKEIFDSIRRSTNTNSLSLPTRNNSLQLAMKYENHDVVMSLTSRHHDDNRPTMSSNLVPQGLSHSPLSSRYDRQYDTLSSSSMMERWLSTPESHEQFVIGHSRRGSAKGRDDESKGEAQRKYDESESRG